MLAAKLSLIVLVGCSTGDALVDTSQAPVTLAPCGDAGECVVGQCEQEVEFNEGSFVLLPNYYCNPITP